MNLFDYIESVKKFLNCHRRIVINIRHCHVYKVTVYQAGTCMITKVEIDYRDRRPIVMLPDILAHLIYRDIKIFVDRNIFKVNELGKESQLYIRFPICVYAFDLRSRTNILKMINWENEFTVPTPFFLRVC